MPSYPARCQARSANLLIPTICPADYSDLPFRSLPGAESGEGQTQARKGDAVAEKEDRELTEDELDEQNAEELPDREVMTVINPGVDGIATIAPVEPEGT
jgi:hypothetical protein